MQRLLFICSKNRFRSPTAEQVFSTRSDLECDSAGLAPDAASALSPEQIEWADVIFVMEDAHRRKLSQRFRKHLGGKRVIVLGIPDDFGFMDDDLIAMLNASVPGHLR